MLFQNFLGVVIDSEKNIQKCGVIFDETPNIIHIFCIRAKFCLTLSIPSNKVIWRNFQVFITTFAAIVTFGQSSTDWK